MNEEAIARVGRQRKKKEKKTAHKPPPWRRLDANI